MNIIAIILLLVLLAWILCLNYKIEKEKKRNRILQAFVAGIIRSISNYKSKTDDIERVGGLPQSKSSLPIPYEDILTNIGSEFSKDFLIKTYRRWLKAGRNLYDDSQYSGDGFNFMYLDFFDKRYREWFSNELMPPKNRAYVRDDIKITEANVGELEGEIAMLKDLTSGTLDDTSFTSENIDEKLITMFNHVKLEKLEEAKKSILARRIHNK